MGSSAKEKNLNGVVRLLLIGVAVMSLLKQLVLKHLVYGHATENNNSILVKARIGFNYACFKTKWPSCTWIDSVSFWKIYKLDGSSV